MKVVVYRTFTGTAFVPDKVYKDVDKADEFAMRRETLKYFQKEENWPPVEMMVEVLIEREVELLEDEG